MFKKIGGEFLSIVMLWSGLVVVVVVSMQEMFMKYWLSGRLALTLINVVVPLETVRFVPCFVPLTYNVQFAVRSVWLE